MLSAAEALQSHAPHAAATQPTAPLQSAPAVPLAAAFLERAACSAQIKRFAVGSSLRQVVESSGARCSDVAAGWREAASPDDADAGSVAAVFAAVSAVASNATVVGRCGRLAPAVAARSDDTVGLAEIGAATADAAAGAPSPVASNDFLSRAVAAPQQLP